MFCIQLRIYNVAFQVMNGFDAGISLCLSPKTIYNTSDNDLLEVLKWYREYYDEIENMGRMLDYGERNEEQISIENLEEIANSHFAPNSIKTRAAKEIFYRHNPHKRPPEEIPERIADKSGHVYIAASDCGLYKIGMTTGKPKKRVSSLNTSSPTEITLEHSVFCEDCSQLESRLHDAFDEFRVKGEWFELSQGNLGRAIVFMDKHKGVIADD